ncbi:calmin [Stegastes partitus]|uniref:Calmin n=1 Tax=Stegastes partitus TaxID=144197 RepID=A0A9Y4NAS0_9TELE|nr:PREDICTED: calmin [Stegastes partitus]
MAGHGWEDWFEREEFIGQISDIRVQNLQVEREMVQKRTFTRWINLHLEKCDPPIEIQDLFQDIQDGRILMALLEELSGCKLLHGFKKSSHRIFRLNNIAKVLSFLEERNVKLVSIDAADVADGNSSIILGLIWNIILFFQIKELTGNIRSQFPSSSSLSSIPTSSDSDLSYCSTPSDERQSASTAMREHGKAIKKLLQWVQKRTRKYGVAVQDFGKSWTSGLAFLAVIKSIDPSLVDMRRALLRSARENLEDAFRIAHYSLGIPRLLEPEDVSINTPDEQSIMTYVSQFLEHFPGKEESEQPCQMIIERSISMGRLNFRDKDSEHMRNGAHRSRVRERSYMFQKDCVQPPPKILISSVSEDRGAASPGFRMAATRSWSSEDFLSDTAQTGDISSPALEDTKTPASEILPNLISDSPEVSYAHSPTSSSVPESVNTESVIGDSAISSPESWVDSEFGVTPAKFCESRSDSSLCDSGTAWDVYRATPVEVTALDEGLVPSTESRATDDQSMTDSYTDEGIYSLSSLESNQGRIQEHSGKKLVVLKDEEVRGENHNQDLVTEHGPGQVETEVSNEKDGDEKREQTDTSQHGKDKVPREPELGSGLCDAEVPAQSGAEDILEADESGTEPPLLDHPEEHMKLNSVEKSMNREDVQLMTQDHEGEHLGQHESLETRNKCEKAEVETVRQKTDSEDQRKGANNESEALKKTSEGRAESQDEGKDEELLRDNPPDPKDSRRSESCKPSESTQSTNQEGTSQKSLGPGVDINIPLISISSEPDEQDNEGTRYPEGPEHADDPTPSGLIKGTEDKHSDGRDEQNTSNTAGSKQEVQSPPGGVHSGEDSTAQSSTDTNHQLISTDAGTTDQSDGHQNKPAGASSDTETVSTQQNTLDPLSTEPHSETEILVREPAGVSTDMDLFYGDAGRSSPTEDLVGDPVEPMDLFYPDKEEPMFTEPPDTEMQSWPSVLSVSPLQPAPASEVLQDDQQLNLLGDECMDGRTFIQEQDQVFAKTSPETDSASESQDRCLLPGEKTGRLVGDDVQADDLREAEQEKPDSARENTEHVRVDNRSSNRADESQTPPVLRHRKGARLTGAVDAQRAAPRKADKEEDFW